VIYTVVISVEVVAATEHEAYAVIRRTLRPRQGLTPLEFIDAEVVHSWQEPDLDETE